MAREDNSAPVVADAQRSGWFDRMRANPSYRLIALIVACAMFMEQIDATVLATALPAIARDYHEPVVSLSSAITAYLLALAVFIPVSGRLADRWGTRTVFRAAVITFMAGSILCALAPSIAWLTAARFLQGAGGAMMVPVGRLAILRVARKDQILSASAWLLIPMLIGPIVGPPLGGLIVTHLNWRWIFYVNLPIGALGIVLISLFIENARSDKRQKLDWPGFALCAVALGALLFGFSGASQAGGGPTSALSIAAGLILGTLYILHARHAEKPVLDMTLLGDRSFRLSMIAGSLTRITNGAQAFLLPLLFQVGLGKDPVTSGGFVLSLAVGALIAKAATEGVLRRFGFRNTMLFNGLALSLLFASCGLIRANWPPAAIIALLAVSGFIMSVQFSAYNSIAFEHIEHERLSTASSFYFTFQQTFISLGVCVGALALHGGMLAARHGEPRPGDFTIAFAAVSGITALAWFAHLRFPTQAGAGLNRRPADAEPATAQ